MHHIYRTSSRRVAPWLVALLLFGFMGIAQPAHAAEVVIDAIEVKAGGTLTMRATGFNDREVVNSWVSGTDGTVITTENGITSDGVVNLTIKVGRFWQPGWWAITIRGSESDATAVGTFKILATPPDGVVEKDRQQVAAGEWINFRGTGFAANEPINGWLTLPDNTAAALPLSLRSDRNGEVYFGYTIPAEAAPGTWSVTTYGLESERLLIGSFTVVR